MFCSRCGGAIDPGAAFCGKCGVRAMPTLTPSGVLKRPGVITLLAILEWIGGSIWLLIGALGLVLTLADTGTRREPSALAIYVLMLAIAVFQLACGFGLWKLRPYGRQLLLIASCVGLLAIPLGTAVSIAILIYLSKPGIKVLFSGRPVEALTPDELSLVAAATTSSGIATAIIAVFAVLLVVAVVGIVAAIAVPGLLRARMAGNEAATIGSLRALVTAETSYAVANGGFYDRPECLVRPSVCLPGYSGAAFLPESPGQKNGYRFTFSPGPAPPLLPPGASRSSMAGFVMMAAPVARETGSWVFCVDHTAQIRRAEPAAAAVIEAGASCPADWSAIR
jgi:type IV pilus assembly protein PilA